MIEIMNPAAALNERVQEYLSRLEAITAASIMTSQGLLRERIETSYGME